MAHVLEFFSGGCPLCTSFLHEVQVGKCGPCRLRVFEVAKARNRARVRKYGVRVVPTLVIDGKIMVEGRIDEPWICGDDFYAMLEQRYPLVNVRLKQRRTR